MSDANKGAILALDAAAAACSVALLCRGRLLAHRQAPMARGHAEALMPLVMEIMAEARIDFADLAKVAVGVGPGSFTGIRIALAAARGIALAAGLPAVGIDSFSAVAATLPAAALAGRTLLVVIDSKREELFGQYFDSDRRPLGAPLVLGALDLLERRPAGPLILAGDGAARLPDAPGLERAEGTGRPDARAIALLAEEGRVTLDLRPLYLRAPDVTLPRPRPQTGSRPGSMSEPAMLIRPAGAFDLERLAVLHAACFAEAWDAEALAVLLAMPGAFGFVAASAHPPEPEEGPSGLVIARAAAGEAEIISLAVRPRERRRGLGRRLLDAAAAESLARGAGRVYLEVAADNLAARALYLGAGFAQVGRRANYHQRPEGAVAALVLARDAGPIEIPGTDG
jgi:tRNA threonylcarbamoyladenosine biosynthesis protein TsaB